MRTRLWTICVALLAGVAISAATAAGPRPAAAGTASVSAASVTHFQGTVTASSRHGRWVAVHVPASARVVRFHTSASTRWESCNWSDMERGHLVAIGARKANGLWLAVTIAALHHPIPEQ